MMRLQYVLVRLTLYVERWRRYIHLISMINQMMTVPIWMFLLLIFKKTITSPVNYVTPQRFKGTIILNQYGNQSKRTITFYVLLETVRATRF
jgi:hypothetical protein